MHPQRRGRADAQRRRARASEPDRPSAALLAAAQSASRGAAIGGAGGGAREERKGGSPVIWADGAGRVADEPRGVGYPRVGARYRLFWCCGAVPVARQQVVARLLGRGLVGSSAVLTARRALFEACWVNTQHCKGGAARPTPVAAETKTISKMKSKHPPPAGSLPGLAGCGSVTPPG